MTGHKLYGPSGIGVLYGKTGRLKEMRPFMGGGEMIEEVTEDRVTYNDPPHRFEAGTPPIVQAIGLGYALDYMEKVGREAIRAHEASLTAYARERLSSVNSLRVFGDAPGKGSIFPSRSPAYTPMTYRWSSTVPALRCAPERIVRSRS